MNWPIIKLLQIQKMVDIFCPVGYKLFSHALVAQLDRATDYESVGREFESLQARQKIQALTVAR